MGKMFGSVSRLAAIVLLVGTGALAGCGDDLAPMPSTINGTSNPSGPAPQTADAATDAGPDGGATGG
jgi:hypothetical protein